MEKLDYSITINAPVKTVWHTMLDDETYRKWTEVFAEGSHFEGDWNEGSKILFLAPGEDGTEAGMVSRVEKNRPYEHISIRHVGLVKDGVEDTDSEEVQQWTGMENYTFRDKGDKTEVLVEMHLDEQHREMFDEMWPKALQKLKGLAERSPTG